jgi:FkbH-like protein
MKSKELTFLSLKNNLKKDFTGLKVVKIALLGDTSTQLLAYAIRGYGYEVGLNLKVFEADYDQIDRLVFDTSSELYASNPEIVLVFHSKQKLAKHFSMVTKTEKSTFASNHVDKIRSLYKTLLVQAKCKVIYCNFPEEFDIVFGNYANKNPFSFLFQLRTINSELMHLAAEYSNFFINDLSSMQSLYGAGFTHDTKIYINTDIILSLDFLPLFAKNIVDIISAIIGRAKKCLILDLDNTVWGGIIGDAGIENIEIGELGIGKAFTEFQSWVKQLKQRGIIIAVCSKNAEDVAMEPFKKHPDMVLRLEDIAVFVANWNNKVDNIRYIQQVLNIGFDSMVFLDDSAFERNMVRENITEITVPELPEDPADYIGYLQKLNLFETISSTEEDEKRTQQYHEEAKRTILHESFANEADFLANLNMIAHIKPFDSFSIPRVSQLTQRSNQFNLRTIRYTEEEIKQISLSIKYLTLSFFLEDKFGDYGLICVIILKKNSDSLFIDTWIMSCRVLKRGIEAMVLSAIVEHASSHGFMKIIGEYIPTHKNSMVQYHYRDLGFTLENGFWILQTPDFKPHAHYIKVVNN